MSISRNIILAALAMGLSLPVSAQVKVGVTVSATGPAASLGIPERNAIELAPREIGGQQVEYIVLDDRSDPTAGRRNFDRFVNEHEVDVVIGSSTSPISMALVEAAGRSKTPMISLGAAAAIIHPMDDNRRWVFKTPYNDSTTAASTIEHMRQTGIESVATLAFNDAYGESWVNEFTPLAEAAGIDVVENQKFSRTDTSVTAQVLRIASARPDAVLIVASGTPGVLPQASLVERGYQGAVYQTTGVVNNDFIRVGGQAVEGTLIAAAPLVVANQLPDSNPAKEVAQQFSMEYEAEFGDGATNAFAGYAWDAVLIMQAALEKVLADHEPGSEQFRTALRDAIEGTENVPTTAGPNTMAPDDHNGYSKDAPVMITIRDGKFTLAD
ncbi:MAG: ABC transporter substrate-binding protein [Aquisalimonadaceae bacterium]